MNFKFNIETNNKQNEKTDKKIISFEEIKKSKEMNNESSLASYLRGIGIPVTELHFPDNRIILEGSWEKFFPAIPQEVYQNRINKFEYIIDNEQPIQCLTFEYFPRDSGVNIRGVFSIKRNGNWYQILRYQMRNFENVIIEIRSFYDFEATKESLLKTFNDLNDFKVFPKMERLFEILIKKIEYLQEKEKCHK